MATSTAELVGKVKGIQGVSDQLSTMIGYSSLELQKSAATLAALTQGSRSGEEATNAVRTASGSLNKAALSLRELVNSCDEFIQNAVK